MQSIKIKCAITSEIKIIEINPQDDHVVTMVLSAARETFSYGPLTLRLTAMDEDGDWVTISTPEEMRKSFQAQKNAGKNTPIFGILCLAPATPAPTWEGPAAAPTAPRVSEGPSKEHAHAHTAPQECPKTHFSEAPHVHQGWAATPQAPHSHHAEEHHPSHPHAEDPHHPTHPGWKHGGPQWHHPQKCGGWGGKWEGPHHHWAEKMKWWRAMMHHHHANKHWGASHCGKW